MEVASSRGKPDLNMRSLKHVTIVVQLGGLEPPTSCSTDRRSNQLSYNCILRDHPGEGCRTGGKLGATAGFGKTGKSGSSSIAPPPCGRVRSRAGRAHEGCAAKGEARA